MNFFKKILFLIPLMSFMLLISLGVNTTYADTTCIWGEPVSNGVIESCSFDLKVSSGSQITPGSLGTNPNQINTYRVVESCEDCDTNIYNNPIKNIGGKNLPIAGDTIWSGVSSLQYCVETVDPNFRVSISNGVEPPFVYIGQESVGGSCTQNNSILPATTEAAYYNSNPQFLGWQAAGGPTYASQFECGEVTCFRCTGYFQSRLIEYQQTCNAPSPTVTLTPDSQTIDRGQSATLNYTGTNIVSGTCSIDNGVGAVSGVSGTKSVSPTANTTYTITCNKTAEAGGGTISDSAIVNVNQPVAPTVTLSTNKNLVWSSGDPVTLTWSSTNATSCTNNFNSNTDTSGTASNIQPTANATYTVTCTGAGGTATDSVTVNVQPLPTVDLKVRQTGTTSYDSDDLITITSGQTVDLEWTSTNTGTCGGGETTPPINSDKNGYISLVQVANTRDYRVVCWQTINGITKDATDSITVTVNQPAPACGSASWEIDGWNLYNSASDITSNTCSVGTLDQAPTQYTDTNSNKTNFQWSCVNGGQTQWCYALKTPTVTLTANPTSITNGSSSNLTLTTENVKPGSCTSSQFTPNVSTPIRSSTNYSVSPTANTTYQVTCTTAYYDVPSLPQQYSAQASVSVNTLTANLTLQTDKTQIWADADTSNLSWTGTNVQNCRFSQGTTGNISNPGTQAVSPDVTTTYKVTCDKTAAAGGGTIDSNIITINVIPLPTATLTATPNSIWQGSTTTLSWTSSNTTSCSNNFNSSTATSSVGFVINPTASTTYSLSCSKTINTNSTRTATANASVMVNTVPQTTVDLKVKLDGSTNPYADSLTLTGSNNIALNWNAQNASACTVTGFTMNPGPTLNQTVSPISISNTTTYTITCTNSIRPDLPALNATDQVIVTINYSAPTCGPANNQSLFSQPTGTNACSSGSFVEVADTSTQFKWACSQPGHTNVQCFANIIADDGSGDSYCGSAKDKFYTIAPSGSSLCVSGTNAINVSQVTKSDKQYWGWTCQKTDVLGVTKTSSCNAYIRPSCPSPAYAENECNNPIGSIVIDQQEYDTKFGWSCAYDYSEVGSGITGEEKTASECLYNCQTGYIVYGGVCVNKGQVDIIKFEPNKKIINKGENCELGWEVKITGTTAPNNTVTCVITGSGTHSVSYTGDQTKKDTKTFSDIQNKSDYTLTCSINGVTSVTGITTDSAQASCIINPDFEEI